MLKKRFQTASQLDGVIDLERLHSGPSDSIERDAARFFELTFPSDEIHALLRALSARFSGEHSAGTILAQAVKGLGKSHTLLLAYHLFKSLPEARAWMSALGYEWSQPADTVVLVQKFTDRAAPKDALWLLVGDALGVKWNEKTPPTPDDLIAAIGSRRLVIVFDELERGVQGIVNDARRKQNLSFLQMLSETANRDARVTSDHGYVFLKSGFSDTRLKSADRPLNGKRFRFFSAEEALPANVPRLRVDAPRRLAILAGRAHNRPQGPSASQSVYRHGGLSIMEMLTPWLVLGPVGSI